MGSADVAFEHFRAALLVSKTGMDLNGEAAAWLSQSKLAKERGLGHDAINFALEGLSVSKSSGNRLSEGEALRALAEGYLCVGKVSSAIAVASQAHEIAEKCGCLLDSAKSLGILGRVYRMSSSLEEAKVKLERARAICGRMEDCGSPITCLLYTSDAADE